MVPCGIAQVQMTSVAREIGDRPAIAERTRELVAAAFADVFTLELTRLDANQLEQLSLAPVD
jgi:hypothetical protein